MGCTWSDDNNKAKAADTKGSTKNKTNKKNTKKTPKAPGDIENAKPKFRSVYQQGEKLGEGAFSIVHRAVHKENGQEVAVKIIDRFGIPPDDEKALRSEVEILRSLEHDNIVRMFDFFEEKKHFYVVLEFVRGGELFDRLVKKTSFNEKEARDVVRVVCEALKYCHDRGIAHRDLKPENLLLTSSDENDLNLKIADFGFAIKGAGQSALRTQLGTPHYVAPEIITGKAYDISVDMWSMGVIMFVLLGGYPPFDDENQKKMFRKIKKAQYDFHEQYWSSVTEEAKDLIRGMLEIDATKRLTVDQVLSHPWITRDGSELAQHSLNDSLASLRKYQRLKRLRAAANAVIAINRMNAMFGGESKSQDLPATEASGTEESKEFTLPAEESKAMDSELNGNSHTDDTESRDPTAALAEEIRTTAVLADPSDDNAI